MPNIETPPYRHTGMGIQQIDVWMAAERVLAEGVAPTINNVRTALGDTGSPNTIQRHLKDWWQQVAARLKANAGVNPDTGEIEDDEIQFARRAIEQAVAELHRVAVAKANSEVDQIRRALEVDRQAVKAKQEELLAMEKTMVSSLADVRAERDRALKRADEVDAKNASLEAAAEKAAAAAADRINALTDAVSNERLEARRITEQAEEALRNARAEIESLRAEAEALVAAQRHTALQLEASQAEAWGAKQAIAEMQAAQAAAEAELAATRNALAVSERERAVAVQALTSKSAELAALGERWTELQSQLTQVREQIARDLSGRLDQLLDEKDRKIAPAHRGRLEHRRLQRRR